MIYSGCFFQFVDKDGRYLRHTAMIPFFNASIELSNSYSTAMDNEMGLQIFNGHLLNCTLHTQAGPTSTGTAFLRKLIHIANDLWPWSSRHVSSPPYFMCLCDIHNHSQELWDCKQTAPGHILWSNQQLHSIYLNR